MRKAAKRPIKIGYAPTCSAHYPVTECPEDIEATRSKFFACKKPDAEDLMWCVSWWSDPVILGRYPEDGLQMYKDFLGTTMFKMDNTPIPLYVLYAVLLTALMWFIWNKTTFGKNMFAVGSNAEAAKVSGVNVFMTTMLVHTLAGAMYGYSGFVEGFRSGSIAAGTGANYECDAIAACVIGGVSFVGGTGKISGIVLGVFVLRIIFIALTMLGVSSSSLYIIKGAIILCACALDMRKYLVKK